LVKIRLKRMGAKKRPFYRLVVADSRSPRDGRFIELLGFYDPLPNPAKVQIDADKVREWIGKGARPSDAARALLVEQGILAKVPRVFKPAPEPTVAAGASETPGAAEEVDAVPAEDAGRPVTEPATPSEAAPEEPADVAEADPEATIADAATEAEPAS
jgi:small subunit ribosomal protein S16